jgi:exosortase H (IPTLxxWG-CTERM-specific)
MESPLSQRPDQTIASHQAMLRFLGIFFVTVAVYYSLTLSPWIDANVFYPVMEASASGTSMLLNLIGAHTTVEGVVVRGPDYSVAVRRGCDPLEPVVLFAAGVVAFPTPWGRRLVGLVLGGACLFGLNLLRIGSLYVLGSRKSPIFDSCHLWWWPAFFIICSLALWVGWLLWVQRAGLSATPAGVGVFPTGNPRPTSKGTDP